MGFCALFEKWGVHRPLSGHTIDTAARGKRSQPLRAVKEKKMDSRNKNKNHERNANPVQTEAGGRASAKNSTAFPYGNGYERCKREGEGCILPAGTPKSGCARIEDPTVPNRAHTEMRGSDGEEE